MIGTILVVVVAVLIVGLLALGTIPAVVVAVLIVGLLAFIEFRHQNKNDTPAHRRNLILIAIAKKLGVEESEYDTKPKHKHHK